MSLVGQKIGRLKVVSRVQGVKPARYLCLCECGTQTDVQASNLYSEQVKSCGCWKADFNKTHGHTTHTTQSRTYTCWKNIRKRCYSENHNSYKNYGALGIRVAERWHTFENFLADMGEMPAGHSIERKDNKKDYEPGNCLWIPRSKQNRNKRNTVRLTFNGKTHGLADWAEETGLPLSVLIWRVKNGWSTEAVLTTPKKQYALAT